MCAHVSTNVVSVGHIQWGARKSVSTEQIGHLPRVPHLRNVTILHLMSSAFFVA